jgi:hypothetical protein
MNFPDYRAIANAVEFELIWCQYLLNPKLKNEFSK